MWVAKLGKFFFVHSTVSRDLGATVGSGVVSGGELRNSLAFVWAGVEFKNDSLEYVLYGI